MKNKCNALLKSELCHALRWSQIKILILKMSIRNFTYWPFTGCTCTLGTWSILQRRALEMNPEKPKTQKGFRILAVLWDLNKALLELILFICKLPVGLQLHIVYDCELNMFSFHLQNVVVSAKFWLHQVAINPRDGCFRDICPFTILVPFGMQDVKAIF